MQDFVFLNEPVFFSAKAVKKTTLLSFPLESLRQLARSDLSFSQALLECLSKQYKKAVLRSTSLRLKSPLHAVGHYLLHLLIEENSIQNTFRIPHKKALIASHLGMEPETLSRALADLKEMGIDVEGNKVRVSNINTLCKFCDMDAKINCKINGLLNKEECRYPD